MNQLLAPIIFTLLCLPFLPGVWKWYKNFNEYKLNYMQNKTLISFHGDPKIKEFYLARVKAHYDADEIIKGTYWEKGHGCGVGCTIHSGKHDSFETELGITWRLALLEDSLFENLPNKDAKEFPLQFLSAIPVGVDTNLIFKKFSIWNVVDEKEGKLVFRNT